MLLNTFQDKLDVRSNVRYTITSHYLTLYITYIPHMYLRHI